MKTIQYFNEEYLERCRSMKPHAIIEFLEGFRTLQSPKAQSRLISLKVPEPLLAAFRAKATLHGLRYQTQIKRLMQDWLLENRL